MPPFWRLIGAVLIGVLLLLAGVVYQTLPRGGLPSGAGPEPAEPPAPVRFVPLSPQAGVDKVTVCGDAERRTILEFNGTGVGLLDYDGDGWLDIYVVNGGTLAFEPGRLDGQSGQEIIGWYGYANHLYRSRGDGTYEEVAQAAGVDDQGWGQGIAVGDVNGDGRPDLYVTNLDGNRMFLNRGDGTFEDATARLAVSDGRWGASAAFFDLENDGDLDLAVANYLEVHMANLKATFREPCEWKGIKIGCGPVGYMPEPCALYRNEGSGGFIDVGSSMGVERPGIGYPLGILPVDIDADGDLDVYVACDAGPNLLYLNEGNRFREAAAESGVAVDGLGQTEASMGTDAADLNGDGVPEIFVTNFSDQTNTLYAARPRPYRDVTDDAGLADETSHMSMGWGTKFLDYDHDGFLDLLVAQGHIYGAIPELADPRYTYAQDNLLYRGLPDMRFEESGEQAGIRALPPASSRGLAVGDLDNDGDLDWVETVMDAPPRVWMNRGGNLRPWIGFRLEGRISNTDGIGARITITTRGGTPQERTQVRWINPAGSHQSSSDLRAHFGLGDAETVDRVEVRWPSGRLQSFLDLQARRYYHVAETDNLPRPVEPGPGF